MLCCFLAFALSPFSLVEFSASVLPASALCVCHTHTDMQQLHKYSMSNKIESNFNATTLSPAPSRPRSPHCARVRIFKSMTITIGIYLTIFKSSRRVPDALELLLIRKLLKGDNTLKFIFYLCSLIPFPINVEYFQVKAFEDKDNKK